VRIGTLSIVLGFAAVFVLAAVLFFILHNQTQAEADQDPGFYQMRKVLNQDLRQTLEVIGVDPRKRQVVESRDKMIDEDYSWYILNWKVRIKPGFDFEYAKHALETTIFNAEGESETYIDVSDDTIPLKVEAYVNSRLSHRIFFTLVTEEDEQSASFTSPATPRNRGVALSSRWDRMSDRQQALDQQLQNVFLAANIQPRPLMIYEYWENETFPTWVINYTGELSLFKISEIIRDSVNLNGFWFEENFEYGNQVSFALDMHLDDNRSHRVLFSRFPVAKGIELAKKGGENAVYISPPKAAIIIDDIGRSTETATRIMNMDAPVTLSILPHQASSQEIAIRAFRKHHEFMLHLPMEPGDPSISPGVGGIYVSQNSATVRRLTLENIDAIPNVIGVNNHMGSKATRSEVTMDAVLRTLKNRGLFFIDSRTTASTMGFNMARRAGIPTAERQVFLDTAAGPDYQFSVKQLRLMMRKAKIQGSCVAIGHPFDETLNAIEAMIPELRENGIELVFASQIVTKFN
jgi:hypothetical protein